MKQIFILIGLLLSLFPLNAQNTTLNPTKSNSFTEGNARFTFITPRMVRMEYDSAGKFVDDPSFVFIHREIPAINCSKTKDGKWIVIKTDALELRYKTGSGKFNATNLKIVYKQDKTNIINWKPGDVNTKNLKGTFRTLDGADGERNVDTHALIPFENGLLSRDGWYVIDDSNNFLFDNSEWSWVKERTNKEIDWYFLGYASDYKSALNDFTKVAGKVPLPPRYAFGYWWSRYWNYSDVELRDLVKKFEQYNIPLDVLVIDMDWHLTDSLSFRNGSKTDEFGQRSGWTGYTWNKALFPQPDHFLQWLKEKQIKTTLNLHPASGIAAYEEKYPAFAKAMQFDTTQHKNIPFEVADKKFMKNLFDIVLDPLKEKGVSFWWLDWQQWPNSKKINTLSNTWWLNYCFFSRMEKENQQRTLLYHRWGGLGNHRYQIGFSGDALITWQMLDFEPFFTSNASNVLYDYWSHDLGGHGFGNLPEAQRKIDPEMYTRWMQYGVFSPIFRTHSSKDPRLNKEVWAFSGDYFDALSNSIHLRYDLAPYIYTMARKTYDSALALCRPMYYDHPQNEEAYQHRNEYMFGDNMLIMPITAPAVNDISSVKVWLPEGNDWYEWNTGTMLKGGQTLQRTFLLNEYPVYVKAGAIIPMYEKMKNLQQNSNNLVVKIFPGAAFESKLYEDAGDDNNYQRSAYSFTSIRTDKKADGSLNINILPREGSFPGMIEQRNLHIQLYGSVMPESVSLNGVKLNYTTNKENNSWYFSGDDLTVHILVAKTDCDKTTELNVQYPSQQVDINGMIGKMSRLKKATSLFKVNWLDGAPIPQIISSTNQTGIQIEYDPLHFSAYAQDFMKNYKLIADIMSHTFVNRPTIEKCKHYLANE